MSTGGIAIIGMAGRFPAARSTGELWRLLEAGQEATRWLSDQELLQAGESIDALMDRNYVRAAMILPDMEMFDGDFFGFTPREAAVLDPQHRHFLEVCWEALEDAGHVPARFGGSIGVFGGCGTQAYMSYNLIPNRALVDQMGLFLLRHTGNDKDFLTTRVSYLLDLKGPSIGVQTACSTSLVAVHIACQSLLSHECDIALAGGVTIEVPHRRGYRFAVGEVLSSTGHCRAFDDAADGTLFGSGAGVVVLRRLEEALADGDYIYAVIRGSAVNNDGAGKVGYLAPSVDGQARAAAEALAMSEIAANTIDYIEAHGTGTLVGDPIELTALGKAYQRAGVGAIDVGSIKTNIGHLDTAAGVASLIKVALALQNGRIPPTLNFSRPNTRFDFSRSPFRVLSEGRDWLAGTRPRRAGVNSLGVGGTNAHVIVEEAPQRQELSDADGPKLIVLSAKSQVALDRLLDKWVEFLRAPPNYFGMADCAFTTQECRQHFEHRFAVVGESAEELLAGLALASGRATSGVANAERPPVVFMFPGGGAQFPGAARDLYLNEPVFRRAVDDCFAAMPACVPEDLRAFMFECCNGNLAAREALEDPVRSTLAVFVIEYAFGTLWRSWGVSPAAMIGHSAGEYAAAVLADVMTLPDALGIVALRGSIFADAPRGGMLSVMADEARVRELADDALEFAALNAPESVVVSGAEKDIREFGERLRSAQVEHSRVRIDVAAHSRMLEEALPRFRAHMAHIKLGAAKLPIISSAAGQLVAAATFADPEYWVRHFRDTVRFGDGLRAALEVPGTILLEVGPGQTLCGLASMARAPHEPLAIVPSSRLADEPGNDRSVALTAAARLWVHGVPISFGATRGEYPARRIPLPTYAFERRRHWIEAVAGDTSDGGTRPASSTELDRSPSFDNWMFAPKWVSQPITPSLPKKRANWLMFADDSPRSRAIVGALSEQGEAAIVVEAGDNFLQRDAHRFEIRPTCPEDYAQLLGSLDIQPTRILHLWSLDAPALNNESGCVDQPLSFDSLFLLGQALQLGGWTCERWLGIGTSGAVSPQGEPLSCPERAALIGLCRVLPREIVGLTSQVIDIDSTVDASAIAMALLAEANAGLTEPVVAYRGGARWVVREEPVQSDHHVRRLRDRGVYLITGGLGGLGLELASHLAKTLKARLAFTSREAFPDRKNWATIAESPEWSTRAERVRSLLKLEKLGAEVLVLHADVTNLPEMRQAVATVREQYGAIHGAFHAAGILEDGLLATKTLDDAHRVLAPKIVGARILDKLFPRGSLDIFAVFSSTSAIVGPPGQSDYAAANAALEAIAAARSDGLSIGFGVWADVGMATRLAIKPVCQGKDSHNATHPLLGTMTRLGKAVQFTASYDPSALWVLAEHRIAGLPILPGMAYVEIGVVAAKRLGLGPHLQLRNLNFVAPLALGDGENREMRTTLTPLGDDAYRCSVESLKCEDRTWRLHFDAVVAPSRKLPGIASQPAVPLEPVPRNRLELTERGVSYGPRWQCLVSAACFADVATGEVSLNPAFAEDLKSYQVHPALLDVGATVGLLLFEPADLSGRVYVPVSVDAVTLHASVPERFTTFARLVSSKPGEYATFDVEIIDKDRCVATLEGLTLRVVDGATLSQRAVLAGQAATEAPSLDRMLAAGIRATDAPEVFARALAWPGRRIVVSSIPLAKLCAAYSTTRRKELDTSHDHSGEMTAAYADELEARIARMCAEVVGIEALPPEANFISYGGGSLAGVRLFAKIRSELGIDLSLSALFQAPTVRQLARLLRRSSGDASAVVNKSSPLVCIARGTPKRRPLFCVHGAGGNVVVFKPLADRLSRDLPFFGLQAQGVDGRAPFQETIEEMASTYVSAIRSVDPIGPYRLAGFSGGGTIAFEMAQQISRDGGAVELLAMFDTLAPDEARAKLGHWEKLRVLGRRAMRFLAAWPIRHLTFRLNGLRDHLRNKGLIADKRSRLEILGAKALEAFMNAQARYYPMAYQGSILLFCASMGQDLLYLNADVSLGWSKLAVGGVEVHTVRATHDTMFVPPGIETLAEVMNTKLSALDVYSEGGATVGI